MDVIEHVVRPAPEPEVVNWRTRLEAWLHRPGTANLILVGSLVVTALAWWAARHFAIDDARQRFERRTDEIQSSIERRMASYEAMLRNGVATLAADPDASRDAWRRFVQTVAPEKHYPGTQGFGVARLIRPADLAAHEASVRREGFPGYFVKPAGPRDVYSAIVYLEPFEKRNLRAFGFDMMSEPTRRDAMERARISGQAAMSGVVTLVQEDGQDVQRGLLLYVPVYSVADGLAGAPARPDALWGWVYAPLRVGDLMKGVLGSNPGNIAFRITDASAGAKAEPIFATERQTTAQRRRDFTLARPLAFGGRTWRIDYEGRDFETMADAWQSNLVAACGLGIDLLLYWSISSLSRRKRQMEAEVARRSAQAEKRLAWLTAVTGLSADAVLVFELDDAGEHRLVFTNPAFSRLFGLDPHELIGLTEAAVDEWLDRLAGSDGQMPPLAAGEARLVIAGPPRRELARGMRESERQRVYYLRDITHESEIERMKNEFLSTAAHELRTPLASVYGFSELLLNDAISPAQRERAVQIVHRQAATLKHLVDALLDLARLDSRHGRDFVVERTDLRAVAERALESMLQPGQMPRVNCAFDTKPVWVDVDVARARQAIVNVLSNALKYSPSGASVSLSVHATRHGGVPQACLRVVDCGIGMTPEQTARAFERFYRADPSGHVLGAGLGLAIVKEIVELQHGRVELNSNPGAGTQVTVWLPLQADPSGAAPSTTPVPRVTAPA